MANGVQWGCALTICAIQALVPAPAAAEPVEYHALSNQSLLQTRIQGLGLVLPGGIAYELRIPEQDTIAAIPHLGAFQHQQPGAEFKFKPYETKSLAVVLQDKLHELRAYTGKDFDPLRLNLRASGLKPSILIENLYNDDKDVDSTFNSIKSFEIEEDEVTLKIYFTF